MKRLIVSSAILVVGVVCVASSPSSLLRASQTGAAAPVTQPDPANFTGKVTGYATTDIRMNRYSFEPGGRTNWHSHEAGQSVYIEEGHARVQERGGPVREFGPRTAFTAPPGVAHWHGALPNEPLKQVSLSFGVTTWMDKVTDAEYAGPRR
jgi:quercetin dioxygenase-like cupin family protein